MKTGAPPRTPSGVEATPGPPWHGGGMKDDLDMNVGLIALLKILAVFACMLTGMRLKLGTGPSVLAGSLLMALLFGLSPWDWTGALGHAMVDPECLLLAGVVILIMMLSFWLESTGQTARLMAALSGYLPRPALRLIFFPVLLGLLPMPGGAVFSAPMVRAAGDPLGVTDVEQTLVNYWYRHVWEPSWPLFPGIILAASLAGKPLAAFMVYTAPATLACFFLGWLFILRPLGSRLDAMAGDQASRRDLRLVARLGLPFIVAIAGSFLLEGAMVRVLPGLPFELGIIAALLAALAVTAVQAGVGASLIRSSLKQKELWQTLVLVVGIFTFNGVLQQGRVVQALVELGGGLALFMSAVFAPVLVGVVSGITLAYVGATFPLLLGMLAQLGLSDASMAWMMLAFLSGFAGVMASPLHICFAMSCQYFGADPALTWRRLLAPSLGLFGFGVLWFKLLGG